MVLPSHIASVPQRDFRNLMRLRHFLISKATDLKNRMHSIFQAELFHISSVLTVPFGLSGKLIISGIIAGRQTDKILQTIPMEVLEKKHQELRDLLNQRVSPAALLQLDISSRMLDSVTMEIKRITQMANDMVKQLYPREFVILCSISGVGEITAMTLLSEIGNFKDFASGDKLAAWVGLVPKVYQSADHNIRAGITRRGSKDARWVMTQATHAAARQKKSRFRNFYDGKKDRLGASKTIVALARKMLTIAWHLIVNDELFKEDDEVVKQTPKTTKRIKVPLSYTVEGVIEMFVKAKKAMDNTIGYSEEKMDASPS